MVVITDTTESKKTVKTDQPPSIVKELVSGKEELEKPATKEKYPERRRVTKINQKGRGVD